MDNKNQTITAEIKIRITPSSLTELQEFIGKIQEDCNSDCGLSFNVDGNFSTKTEEQESPSQFDAELFKAIFESVLSVYTKPENEFLLKML